MKPTFRLHFSEEHPDRPGLWIGRRDNFISVLTIDDTDLKRAKLDPSWLAYEWGAHLELVDRDVVPLDRRKVQEHLDQIIVATKPSSFPEVLEALQVLRANLLGNRLELPPEPGPEPEPEA